MTRDERMNPERCRNKIQRDHLRYIEEDGVSILNVAPLLGDQDDTRWGYTIGLWQQHSHPEVIIFGLGPGLCVQLLNRINKFLKDGRRFDGGTSADDVLAGYLCYFENILPANYGDWFAGDTWFYDGDDFSAVQMIWPTPGHVYPWQTEADDDLATVQPIISSLPKRAVS